MRVHHLNCGTINVPGGASLIGTGGFFTPARGVTHCILAETDDGLLLVDTGWGTRDCLAPTLFMRWMTAMGGHPRDLKETAVKQVERLGYAAEDVRHIALTHFHFDHAGGLPDFPQAKVHIYREEYEAVTQPRDMYERYPYRAEHRAHRPHWVVHDLAGDQWFGFDCTPLIDLGSVAFCLVPLTGHTRGHSAVALRLPHRVSVQNLGTCSVFPTGAAKRHTFGATRPTSMLCMALFRADAPPTTYFPIY